MRQSGETERRLNARTELVLTGLTEIRPVGPQPEAGGRGGSLQSKAGGWPTQEAHQRGKQGDVYILGAQMVQLDLGSALLASL